MRNIFLFITTPLAAMLMAGNVFAIAVVGIDGKATAASTTSYQKSGTINSIDLGSRAIVIDGISYLFPSTNVKLHTKTKSVANAQQLKKGMHIGFNSKPGSAGARAQISDVWVLGN